jgi:DNA-binding NarL/FixJ family response regulator
VNQVLPSFRLESFGRQSANFVGRVEELRFVGDLLYRANGGFGSSLAFVGRRGIGKTHLLQRCLELWSKRYGVVAVSCSRAQQTSGIVTQVLAQLGPGSASTRGRDPAESAYDLLTGNARRRPQLVLVDDIHLASVDDLALLDILVDAGLTSPIVLVAALYQVNEKPAPNLAESLQRWIGRGLCRRELPPLSRAELGLLARNLVLKTPTAGTSHDLGQLMLLSGGNPRYAQELVREVLSSCENLNPVPYSAATVVAALQSSASPEQLAVLATAALIGERFSESWLRGVLSSDDDAIAGALQIAADAGILHETGSSPGFHEFVDCAVRKSLTLTIVSLRRSLLHKRIAAVLSKQESHPPDLALIAEHWEASGDVARAADWLERAAAYAAQSQEWRAAGDLYERAAAAASGRRDDSLELLAKAAVNYEEAGAVDRALPLREAIVAGLDSALDPERFAKALSSLIRTYWVTGLVEKAMEAVRILQTMTSPLARGVVARTAVMWALWLLEDGRRLESRGVLRTIRKRDVPKSSQSLHMLVSVLTESAEAPVDVSLAKVEGAMDCAERTTSETQTAWMLIHAANLACRSGRLDAAKAFADRADRFAAREGPGGKLGLWTKLLLAEMHAHGGNLTVAQELLAPLMAVRDAGSVWETNLAPLCVYVGMRTGASVLVDGFFDARMLSEAVARRSGFCGPLLRAFSEVMVARGLSDELTRLLRSCAEHRIVDPYFSTQLAIARFGPNDCFEAAREQLSERLTAGDAASAVAAQALFDAFVAKRIGSPARSAKAAVRAAAAYRALGWRLHEALALEVSGDTSSSRALYEQCGATQDVSRLSRRRTRRGRHDTFGARLTSREQEVARLACEGATNPEIARRLGTSERTVHHHIASIFGKLGIRARWQLLGSMIS